MTYSSPQPFTPPLSLPSRLSATGALGYWWGYGNGQGDGYDEGYDEGYDIGFGDSFVHEGGL